MNPVETSEQNGSPLPRLETKGKGTAGNDLELKVENVCPYCGGELMFGSRDPCEGDYYWCRSYGCGPIQFPLYHVMPSHTAPIVKEKSPKPGKPGAEQTTIITRSPFARAGSIRIENRALRIDYESFGNSYTVHIGPQDLNLLVRDRFAPAAPVRQMRKGIDGSEIDEKIGYACRTVSGKALKISTSTSGGDMIVPWNGFLQVVNHKIKSAAISRIKKEVLESPRSPPPKPSRNIQEGLSRGF
jgi:hypothetical protein